MTFRPTIWTCLLLLVSILAPQPAYSKDFGLPKTAKVAHISGMIDTIQAIHFATEMLSTRSIPGDRLILIDSGGGEVEAGNQMLRVMEQEQAQGTKMVCLVTHEASSMAFNILTHCDVRLAEPRAYMLVHKVARGMLNPYEDRLTAVYLRKVARDLDRIDAPFRRANALAMHLTLKMYDLFAEYETVWPATMLFRMGYLTGIVSK